MTILRHGFYVKNKHGLSGGAVSAFLVEVRAALERKEVEWGMESKRLQGRGAENPESRP